MERKMNKPFTWVYPDPMLQKIGTDEAFRIAKGVLDAIHAHRAAKVDYVEAECRYATGLITKQQGLLDDNKWHHLALYFDGEKKMDNIVVTWIRHEPEHDPERPIIIGILLFVFGIIQILIGFGALLLVGEHLLAYGLFIFGALVGGAGIAGWLSGAYRLPK